jgi:hypothetical protein
MVLEDPEKSVKPDIYARWLNHCAVERFNLYAASIDFGLDIAIT